jgi:hypothetical protein
MYVAITELSNSWLLSFGDDISLSAGESQDIHPEEVQSMVVYEI